MNYPLVSYGLQNWIQGVERYFASGSDSFTAGQLSNVHRQWYLLNAMGRAQALDFVWKVTAPISVSHIEPDPAIASKLALTFTIHIRQETLDHQLKTPAALSTGDVG